MKKMIALLLVLVALLPHCAALAAIGDANQVVPLGQTYTYTDSDEDKGFSFTTELRCVTRGKTAKTILNRWDYSNTSGLGKNKEWMLIKLHFKAIDAKEESITLKARYFKFVSAGGVEYARCTIINNPATVHSFYKGASQDAWIGCIIDKDDEPLLVYSPSSDTHIWYSTKGRVATPYTLKAELKRGSEGDIVMLVEERLVELAYFTREPDTVYTYDTINAVRQFQRDKGIKATGAIDAETAEALFAKE